MTVVVSVSAMIKPAASTWTSFVESLSPSSASAEMLEKMLLEVSLALMLFGTMFSHNVG